MSDDLASAVEVWAETLCFVEDNMPPPLPESVDDPVFPRSPFVTILVTKRDADYLRLIVDALKDATEWRPIESAPRDGTHVVVFCPGAPAVGRNAVHEDYFADGYWQRSNEYYWPPTKWLPLPASFTKS